MHPINERGSRRRGQSQVLFYLSGGTAMCLRDILWTKYSLGVRPLRSYSEGRRTHENQMRLFSSSAVPSTKPDGVPRDTRIKGGHLNGAACRENKSILASEGIVRRSVHEPRVRVGGDTIRATYNMSQRTLMRKSRQQVGWETRTTHLISHQHACQHKYPRNKHPTIKPSEIHKPWRLSPFSKTNNTHVHVSVRFKKVVNYNNRTTDETKS